MRPELSLDPFGQALLLTLIAGLSTGIGALLTIFLPRSRAVLAQGMAFSAGAMVAVSFVELLPQAVDGIGMLAATAALLLGSLFTFGLDLAAPHLQGLLSFFSQGSAPRRTLAVSDGPGVALAGPSDGASASERVDSSRLALVATLAVALHNFPEGFAVFAGTFQSLQLGLALTVAIAAHNIPEGMAVAAPVLHATGSRSRALWAGLGSGLLEPLGAVCGGLILFSVLGPRVVSTMLAFVAGVMVYVSLDELLPAAREQAEARDVALSVILGIAFMLLTLAMLNP